MFTNADLCHRVVFGLSLILATQYLIFVFFPGMPNVYVVPISGGVGMAIAGVFHFFFEVRLRTWERRRGPISS